MNTGRLSKKLSIAGILSFALSACGGGGVTGGPGGAMDTGGSGSGGTSSTGGVTSPAVTGGTTSSGGQTSSGGRSGSGGTTSSGGTQSSGGQTTTGGTVSTGGTTSSGGVTASGGTIGTGGTTNPGGAGGLAGRDGGQPDLPRGTGGAGSGGRLGTGGAAATGGTTSTGTGTTAIDCNAVMPTSGSDHCGQNTQGTAGGLTWSLWSNTLSSSACITTYSTPAFSARWNNNGDFLARIGLEFGSGTKTYDQYGVIKADFAYKKTGSAGGYSYIGIYGWSTNPCVEWYIVDDRWGTMPFNAYNATQKGTATIDGETYKLFQNKTNGTGGSRCSGVSQWDQFWSIRQTARQCGTITISDHFKAWEAAGLKLGGLLEAKILVETGGGTGNIDFPVATVTKSQ